MVKAFRHPTSGAVVVCNAGAHTGVYRNPPVAEIPPDWIANDPPGFRSPVPNKIAEVLFLHLGTTLPENLHVDAEIGVGTHSQTTAAQGDFAGPFIAAGGTIPAEWLGKQPVAKFTVISGRLSKTLFVPSGVTVEEEDVGEDPFPTALTNLDWTAEEIRDRGPAGRRRIRFLRAIPAAPGFQLVLYSNTGDPDTQPSTSAAVMTPPDSYETGGSLPVGVTCVNRLWWRRINGGALGNPSNVVSFPILGLVSTPPPPATDTTLTPDTTVAYASVRSQIQTWISAWNSTIPSGKTAGSERVLGYTGGNGLPPPDLRNLQNPNAGIIVRPVGGTYTDENCSVKHFGNVNFANSRGIHVALMQVRGVRALQGDNAVECGARYCLFECGTPSTSVSPPANSNAAFLHKVNGFDIRHCVFSYAEQAAAIFSDSVGIRMVGCMTDYLSRDDYKVYWRFDNGRVERCWLGRRHSPPAGGGLPHFDLWQNQGFYEQNNLFWGNVLCTATGGGISRQIFFHKREQNGDQTQIHFAGTSWEQNLGWSHLGLLIGKVASVGIRARYNTAISTGAAPVGPRQSNPANNGGAVIDGLAPRDFNYVASTNGTHVASAGPNGLGRQVGHCVEIFPRTNPKTHECWRYYDDLALDFEHGIPWQTSLGAPLSAGQQTLRAFVPKIGSRLDWRHSNPVGSYLRMRELFDSSYRATMNAQAGYKVIPHAWPVLSIWHAHYNSDGFVPDGYTGAYDANGLPA